MGDSYRDNTDCFFPSESILSVPNTSICWQPMSSVSGVSSTYIPLWKLISHWDLVFDYYWIDRVLDSYENSTFPTSVWLVERLDLQATLRWISTSEGFLLSSSASPNNQFPIQIEKPSKLDYCFRKFGFVLIFFLKENFEHPRQRYRPAKETNTYSC